MTRPGRAAASSRLTSSSRVRSYSERRGLIIREVAEKDAVRVFPADKIVALPRDARDNPDDQVRFISMVRGLDR